MLGSMPRLPGVILGSLPGPGVTPGITPGVSRPDTGVMPALSWGDPGVDSGITPGDGEVLGVSQHCPQHHSGDGFVDLF